MSGGRAGRIAVATAYRARDSGGELDRRRSDVAGSGLYQRLVRAVRRRARDEDAEEVVQDAYLRLSAETLKSEVRDPIAFLHVAAFNLLRDRARAAVVRRAVAGEAADMEAIASDQPSAEDALIARQRLAILDAALNELPPKVRAALVLYKFDGLPQLRIAEELGLSVSMIEKHIRRALTHCQRRLAEADRDA